MGDGRLRARNVIDSERAVLGGRFGHSQQHGALQAGGTGVNIGEVRGWAGCRASCRCVSWLWMLVRGVGENKGRPAEPLSSVQISGTASARRFHSYPITHSGNSRSGCTGSVLAPTLSLHLWPGSRDLSAHENSLQLAPSPPLLPLLLPPGGGCADIVRSTSSGSCYVWQEVQPLRPAALREAARGHGAGRDVGGAGRGQNGGSCASPLGVSHPTHPTGGNPGAAK